jgi:chemotaxis protein histidine kinase CheA
VHEDFADLVPLFVEEARERLDRLAGLVLRVESEPEAVIEAKRELHTLKGAGRMMQIVPLAELAHAAEEVVLRARPGVSLLLARAVDELMEMVEALARGETTFAASEFLLILQEEHEPEEAGAAAGAKSRASAAPGSGSLAEAEDAEGDGEAPEAEGPAAPQRAAAPVQRPAAPQEVRVHAASLDAVAERSTQVRIMALAGRQTVMRLHELARLAEEGLREPQPAQVLAVVATMLRRTASELEAGQRRLVRSAEEQLETMLALQLQPLRGFLRSVSRYAKELARSLGKEIEVEVEGEDTRLDRRIAHELEEALLHLVQNAVDHGFESAAARESSGKGGVGHLRIRALGDASRVRLLVEDDGAGIELETVRRQALAAGIVEPAQLGRLDDDAVLRLLFIAGFSTRAQVSQLSGRGVGLDIVATAAARVGGEVFLQSDLGRGTTVTLEVPVARRGETVLLLRVGPLRIALPAAVVRRATRLPAAAVVERDGRLLARVGPGDSPRLVPFVALNRLYGQPSEEEQLLLEGQVSGHPLAIAVDEVLGEEEVLVRPLPRRVATDRLLEGVALLASGEPVGVLAPALLAQGEILRALPVQAAVAAIRRLRVLLVDDSLVTREMERRLLEDAGFEVLPAGDGHEALSMLSERPFDCVVTDIEMPGMDGFELTQQMRGLEAFTHLPIIVVSTRERPEDRLKGLKVGADAYLTKQSLDAGELVDLVHRLTGR